MYMYARKKSREMEFPEDKMNIKMISELLDLPVKVETFFPTLGCNIGNRDTSKIHNLSVYNQEKGSYSYSTIIFISIQSHYS